MTCSLSCADKSNVTGVIPGITISQTSCTGSTVNFNSAINGGGNTPVYKWTIVGNGTSTNLTGSTLTVVNAGNGTQVSCSLVSNDACAKPVQVNSNTLTINCLEKNKTALEEFKIVPNPNNGNFSVRMKLNSENDVQFRLFNILGQMVYESEKFHISGAQLFSEQAKNINVTRLASGLYQLQTQIGTEFFVRKVVISR
jgi:hypothetical protein